MNFLLGLIVGVISDALFMGIIVGGKKMKLELKENMYVRTKDGIIAKVDYIEDNTIFFDKDLYRTYSDNIDFLEKDNLERIVKASYNIVDLIKSKDIILGRDGKIYQCWKIYKDYVFTYSKNKQGETITLVDYQIDKVLTKEQMEQMAYKV